MLPVSLKQGRHEYKNAAPSHQEGGIPTIGFFVELQYSSGTVTSPIFRANQSSKILIMKLLVCTSSKILALLCVATTAVAHYKSEPDTTAAELQIRNKISLYAVSLDLKNYEALTRVFTKDTVADYRVPESPGPLHGVSAVQDYVRTALTGQTTQHTISTTLVEFTNPQAPNSTAYLVANYLGQGNLTGQAAYVYGKYEDQWTLDAGSWKIKNRVFVLIVS